MEIVNSIFSDLVFTWLERKDLPTETGLNQYIVYGAGLSTEMGGNQRYVLVFVPIHLAIQQKAKIHDLPWKCVQTRTLAYSYKLRSQRWHPPAQTNPEFRVVRREEGYSEYKPNDSSLGLEVVLLHDSKKKTRYQYNNRITLLGAIEKFKTVITYNGDPFPEEPQIYEDYSSVVTPVL